MSRDDGEIEERLRRHYHSSFGPPPSPAEIRKQVARRLAQSTTTDMMERDSSVHRHVLMGRLRAVLPIGARERVEHPTSRSGGRWPAFVALAATLLIIAMGGTVFDLLSAHHGTTASRPTETSSTVLPGNLDEIVGIQMLSDTNGWAIGYAGIPMQVQSASVLHFDGYRWSVVDTLADTNLTSISMVSATDGWIAGYRITGYTITAGQTEQQDRVPFLLHFTAGHWEQEPAPLGLVTFALTMVTANFGWAMCVVPATKSVPHATAQIAVYHDGVWTPVDIPGTLNAWWFTSPTDFWAATYDGSSTDSTFYPFWHYTDGHWSQTTPTIPARDVITGIEMTSPTNGWAIGSYAIGSNYDAGPALFHYNGVAWTQVNVPPSETPLGGLVAFTVVSPTEFWAEGTLSAPMSNSPQYYLMHYANGVWSEVNEPDGFFAWQVGPPPAAVSSNDVWVSGSVIYGDNVKYDGYGRSKAAIVHYAKGQWTIYS